MIDTNDLKQLNILTANLKKDSEAAANFTIEFLDCLFRRYNLKISLKGEIEIEEIPDEIIKTLQSGDIPTVEDLLPLDPEAQNTLIMQMIWFAGMKRISVYCHDEETEDGIPSPIECILAMQDVSAAHLYGSYLFAALALLMSDIPSYDFVNSLCNNFDDSPENIQFIIDRLVEVCISIHSRHVEDMDWFYNFKDDEDEE